jgi:hypothetical protein
LLLDKDPHYTGDFLKTYERDLIMTYNKRIDPNIINGTKVGDNTQNQLQLITLHNLSTTKTTVSRVHNEVPPLT